MYTRNNLNCAEPLLEQDNSLNVNFNTSKKTVWLVHGYRPLGSIPSWLQNFLRILLNQYDVNIVVVDWNRGATTFIYDRAVKNTRKVAVSLSECIQKLLVSLENYILYMLYNMQRVMQDYQVLIKNAFFHTFNALCFFSPQNSELLLDMLMYAVILFCLCKWIILYLDVTCPNFKNMLKTKLLCFIF